MRWPYLSDRRDRCRVVFDNAAALDAYNQIEATVGLMQENGALPFEVIEGAVSWHAVRVQMLRMMCDSDGLDFDRMVESIEAYRIK